MRRLLTAVALASLFVPALASAQEADPDLEAAKGALKTYLTTLQKAAEGKKPKPADVAKKLQGAKKFVHPKTLELIAGQEKKNVVANALAVWHHAKEDYWLTTYEIGEARKAAFNTVVVDTKEKNWRVAEGGEDGEDENNGYLLAKVGGKWLIVDKRRNETFTDSGIKAGYRDYFEAEKKEEPKKEEPKAE